MPTETSACLIKMSAIAMSPARSAASACSSEPVASPSSAPRRLAFAIIVETAWTRVSYFSRKWDLRDSSRDARASVSPRSKPSTLPSSIALRAEMRLPRQVDFFGDPFRITADLVQFAGIDHRLRPSQDLRGHSHVGAEFRVGLDLRPELRQAVPGHPRLLVAAALIEDVFDDLLVLDCLDEASVADRLTGVEQDDLRPARIESGGAHLGDLALDVGHEVLRGRLESVVQPGGHLLRFCEFP